MLVSRGQATTGFVLWSTRNNCETRSTNSLGIEIQTAFKQSRLSMAYSMLDGNNVGRSGGGVIGVDEAETRIGDRRNAIQSANNGSMHSLSNNEAFKRQLVVFSRS